MNYYPLISSMNKKNIDADAMSFITATGISDAGIISAWNKNVIDRKNAGIWAKYLAYYPIIGGTDFTHKWNAKNILDTDAAFRLNFGGVVTHSSTGMVGNGSTGYANTFFNPSLHGSLNDMYMGFYGRTSAVAADIDMGCYDSAAPACYCQLSSYFSGVAYYMLNQGASGLITHADTGQLGLFGVNRSLSNSNKYIKNGVVLATSTAVSNRLPNRNIYLMARRDGSATLNSNREIVDVKIGYSLTDTQLADEYTINQEFQTALGRNV